MKKCLPIFNQNQPIHSDSKRYLLKLFGLVKYRAV